jgi:hypothetical protein
MGRVWFCNILQITIFTITNTNTATITATTTITTTTTTTAPQWRLAAYFLDYGNFSRVLGNVYTFSVLWI